MEERRLLQGGSEAAGRKYNVREKGGTERKIKKVEEKRECNLEPRYNSVLKGKIKL